LLFRRYKDKQSNNHQIKEGHQMAAFEKRNMKENQKNQKANKVND